MTLETPTPQPRRRFVAACVMVAAGLTSCADRATPAPPSPSATAVVSARTAPPAAPAPAGSIAPALLAAPSGADPNPLRLPPRRITLDPGKRVFAVSEPTLRGAKLGSTLVLYAATAQGLDGDDVVIEGRGGPPYKVHGAYVITVPDAPALKPGDTVLTEWTGVMKHAVVTKLVKDRVGIRYTDVEGRAPEALLLGGRAAALAGPGKSVRFVKQSDGLAPGNYAALREGEEWRHVLLVSPFGEGDQKRWLALGFGGAAMLAAEHDLKAIPVRWSPKVGASVLAEWVGTMRKATVQTADDSGIYTVKYDRAGRPATVGFGLLMPPIEGASRTAPP